MMSPVRMVNKLLANSTMFTLCNFDMNSSYHDEISTRSRADTGLGGAPHKLPRC